MARIVPVTMSNIEEAARVHSISWIDAHRGQCSKEFLAQHTPENQRVWIQSEMEKGNRFFLALSPEPCGVVEVQGNLIQSLYVLPDHHREGIGTQLLKKAEDESDGAPRLWVRPVNTIAVEFYLSRGYRPTGTRETIAGGKMVVEEFRKLTR